MKHPGLDSKTASAKPNNSYKNFRIYSKCLNLQTRLLTLPGFATHSEALFDSSDPVACIRKLLCSGLPLCHLFNLLPSRIHPRIELNITPSQDDDYTKRLAIAQFALCANQAFQCDHFTISDVLSSTESTGGFDKALNAVSVVLDQFALTATTIQGLAKPLNAHNGSEIRYENNQSFQRTVKNLLTSERDHVAKMEILENFSSVLATAGIVDPESVSLIFPKKMFVFARKFRIQLECIAQLPWKEQNWGAPFISHAMDITMNLRIHCVNWILVKPALVDFDIESLQDVYSLLAAPLERLSDYIGFLKELILLSTLTIRKHRYHDELLLGVACIQQVMDIISKAKKKTMSDQICEALKTRIMDWQDLSINSLGQLILEDRLLTRRNDLLQIFDVFLFENELLLCDKTLPPPPPNSSRIGRRRVSSASIQSSRNDTLYIKDHIPIHVITSVTRSEFRRVQDNGPQLFFELALFTESHVVSLLHPDHDGMQKWYHELQGLQGKGESGDVQGSLSPAVLIQRKRAVTYDGALADIQNGFLPENSHPSNHRSTFVKLHFGDNSFVLSIPLPVEYEDLLERIDKKLRHSPGWTMDGRIITHTNAAGYVVSVGPRTPLGTIFREGVMASLRVD
ncbi:hypothetical protein EV359DRAFT_80058 [Lentinula novae-zelandiae]|nr:hypothetical protein EV359DRAFT_80058 [Lentinula novae-zelandiae]